MKTIVVGFSKPKTWKPFAALIMKAYGIPYDHVYVRIHSDKYQRDLIYQASKLMVNFMGIDAFSQDNLIVDEFSVEITDDNKVKLMQFAIDNACKPYGISEALGLAIVRMAQICGFTIKNPFGDGGKTYVCSELAGFILQQYAGAQIPENQDDMTPLDIFNYLSSLRKS